ncbi:TraR/DksA C4-type zinc finger protein [Candidatus Uhrbacteria bacterium]|nr:TraR/DksA C4-type zinc finger protein [Candidatus Uhrbacteria bacterium]
MKTQETTQNRLWINDVQNRYRILHQKYLHCTDRSEASYLAAEMRLLEAAILGIEQGATYGICISCTDTIPAERLAILSWTLWCTSCAAEQSTKTRSLQELLFPLKLAYILVFVI